MALAITLTVLAFAGGVALSWWQARRRVRRQIADRLAREVERELARRALGKFAAQASPRKGSPPP